MDHALLDILRNSRFELRSEPYAYARVAERPDDPHFLVGQDEDEITVVTTEALLSTLKILERNKDSYALIALNVSVPFYSVGFLAAVSQAMAQAGMDILLVSTYSKDYLLVRYDLRAEAQRLLLDLGLSQRDS
jgi:hypothetical protein